MATAIPLPLPVPERSDGDGGSPSKPHASGDRVEAARARVRAAGLDPAAVPHAGAETFDGFNAWIGELTALGLTGERLVAVLAGAPIPREEEPADLTALLAELCATGS